MRNQKPSDLELLIKAVQQRAADQGAPMAATTVRVVARALLDEVAARARLGRVNLPGFGIFYTGTTASRDIVDRQSKQRRRLPARWAIRFRAAGTHKGVLAEDEAKARGVA